MNAGLANAFAAFICWGLFPLYFQFIRQVPSLEVVLHRSVWSLLLMMGILAWQRRWAWLGQSLRQPRRLFTFLLSALMLWLNWLVYVHAAQTGHVVEASLGYFINPLVSVLLGVLVLHERLKPAQWVAVGLAACGVAWLTVVAGRPPWIALPLATLGLVQYLSPTIQLVLGVWMFHEPFDSRRLAGFILIWCGLALVSAQALGMGPRLARASARG